MKAFKIYMLAAAGILFSLSAVAQTKTETFKVSGNCGMCKNKIEKAAKEAGAKDAKWDADAKTITVTYKSSTTNTAKIQEKIAGAGYDNEGAKAADEAYNKLPACCHYDREATMANSMGNHKASCCSDKCEMKDGKCADMAACKEKGCCKDEEACKAKGCCSGNMTAAGKMDCCKDGKCTKEGHKGGDCCKKEK